MKILCEKIVKILKRKNQTISFMESCTGGFLANEITNIEGASNIIKVSLVTYSNEFKIRFGVSENILNKYSVYSKNTANQMAIKASEFSDSNWGIGVTGQLGIQDDKNEGEEINKIYYSIYNSDDKEGYDYIIEVQGENREQMKQYITSRIFESLLEQIM